MEIDDLHNEQVEKMRVQLDLRNVQIESQHDLRTRRGG